MQTVQIKNWGNSKAIRIPINILEALNLKENDSLEISADKENKAILLKIDDDLTPYQRLMERGKKTNRKPIVWDRIKAEEAEYE